MTFQLQFMLAAENIGHRVTEFERAREEAGRKAEWYRRLHALLQGLRTSWKDNDPGKYRDHVFFVKNMVLDATVSTLNGLPLVNSCDKVWVPDLVDDATAAREGRPLSSYGRRSSTVAKVPLDDLGAVQLGSCGSCRRDTPLVGNYRQTFDGPDGDEWRLDVFAICIGCPEITPVAVRLSEHRFM